MRTPSSASLTTKGSGRSTEASSSSGLAVGGVTHLDTCANLTEIEDDVDFGELVTLPSGIERMEARPFLAGGIVIRGDGTSFSVEGRKLPRNREGEVVIDTRFIRRAVQKQEFNQLAQIPVLASKVGYSKLKLAIRDMILDRKGKTQRRGRQEPPPSGPKP